MGEGGGGGGKANSDPPVAFFSVSCPCLTKRLLMGRKVLNQNFQSIVF